MVSFVSGSVGFGAPSNVKICLTAAPRKGIFPATCNNATVA